MREATPDSDWFLDLARRSGDVFYRLRVHPDVAFEFISEPVAIFGGYSAEEYMADPGLMFRILDPRDLADLRAALADRSQEPQHIQLRWWHRDGGQVVTTQWFTSRARADGSWILEGTARDITVQWQTEQALRDSEARFRNAMENTAIGMCLVSPAGAFHTVNRALCELLGRDANTLRNTTWQNLTHPGDLNDDVALVDDVLAGRRENYRLLKRYLRPDGSVVWGDMSVSCVRDEEGRVRYFVTQIVDVTAQMQIEQELRASEEQYRLLVEESSDFLIRASGDDSIIAWVSPSVTRVTGWKPEDAIGKSAFEFIHPDDIRQGAANRDRMDGGEQIQDRFRLRCADGSYKWVSHVGRTLTTATLGRISSFQDIDAQVRAEQELARTQEAAHADRQRLRATMDAMLDPHFLISPVRDDSGRIIDFLHIDANDAALAHTGRSRDELIGTRMLGVSQDQATILDRYVHTYESREPMVEDEIPFADPTDPGTTRLYDVRAVRVDEALSVTVRDVTERVEAARALAESKASYRLLAENASDLVYRLHIDGTVEWVSEGVKRILGYPPERFVGHHIDEFAFEPDQDLLDAAIDEALVSGRASVRFRVTDGAGELRWLEATVNPVPVADGDVTRFVGGCRDVHTEMQAMAELDRRARTDHLTGLPNRDEALGRLRLLMVMDRPSPVAVAFCDLDGFKSINDTFGHAVGDEWLQQAAQRIRSCVREGDLVARVGGDEILVVLPGVHNLDRAKAVCEKLRVAMLDGDARSTVSIGVTLSRPGEDVDAVIARADTAMYQAKQSGRNRVVAV